MKLFILHPIKAWEPWYDKAFGFVVCAENESAARVMAQAAGGAEIGWEDEPILAWTDPTLSSCIELKEPYNPGIILRDLWSA